MTKPQSIITHHASVVMTTLGIILDPGSSWIAVTMVTLGMCGMTVGAMVWGRHIGSALAVRALDDAQQVIRRMNDRLRDGHEAAPAPRSAPEGGEGV